MPGCNKWMYVVGVMFTAFAIVKTNPKCPCAPPPKLQETLATLALSLFFILRRDLYEGIPCIFVRIGYSELLVA